MKYNLLFYAHKRSEKDVYMLRMRVRWGDNIVNLNPGYIIDIERWNRETQRCAVRSFHGPAKIPAATINATINRYEKLVRDYFNECEVSGRMPAKAELSDILRARERAASGSPPFDATFTRFIRTQSLECSWSEGTIKKMRTLQNHVNAFRPSCVMDDITTDFMQSYHSWLINRTYTYRYKRGSRTERRTGEYSNTTIEKEIKSMKWFLRWARKNKLYGGTACEDFEPRIKTADKEVIYLEWDELQALQALTLTDMKERVLDGFLFCCFTGLRYSDLANLKKSDIRDNAIHVTTIKDTDAVIIDLNKYSRAILDKYAGMTFRGDRALPVYANQVMNRELKEIARAAGLDAPVTEVKFVGSKRIESTREKWEMITTHCGRRTFIVNAMTLEVSDAIIMSWTGHSSIKAMKPYRKVVDDAKRRAMDKFDELGK